MDAGNTALLIGIIVGLIGSVSVLVGVPIFLLNEEVNRARDAIDALDDKMDAKFAAQDAKIESRFAAQDAKIERRFAAQDAKIEARFAAQATLIESRFAAQDAKIEELRRGQSDIDRKLAVLIASLRQAGLVDPAPEAGTVPEARADARPGSETDVGSGFDEGEDLSGHQVAGLQAVGEHLPEHGGLLA